MWAVPKCRWACRDDRRRRPGSGTFASALICSSVYEPGQRPGSTSTRPLAADGLSSAAASGNGPDCECPINTAPLTDREVRQRLERRVGLRQAAAKLMSGTPCFASSSTAATGNWLSGKGAPGFEPKRKFGQTTSSLKRSQGGRFARRRRSRAHVVEDGLVESRSSAAHLVGDVARDGPCARSTSSQPMRPSGVVSHDLPVRVAPWTITTGTLPSPPCGTMYRTYIWLTVMCPPGPRLPNSTSVCSTFSPPMKKLPCAFSTRGVPGV